MIYNPVVQSLTWAAMGHVLKVFNILLTCGKNLNDWMFGPIKQNLNDCMFGPKKTELE